MTHLMACRVCLAYDIRLHSISGCQLQDIYEKFTETSLESGDTKPRCVCYICFSLLKKFQMFIEKSKKSDQLLDQMLDFGLELSVNSLELFREQQTGLPWTLGKSPMVRVTFATEEEVNVETPIKTEYDNSEMDVGDQNEGFEVDPEKEHDDWNVLKTISKACNSSDEVTETNFKERGDTPDLEVDLLDIVKEEPFAEDSNQDSTSDSEDNMPLQNISKQWKAGRLKKKSKISLKRGNVPEIKTSKIMKSGAREIILSKEAQLQQMLERSKSPNYQNSPFKCDLCYKGFVGTKAFESHQEKHNEVIHLPKKRKLDNETEKEILKSQVSLKKNDKGEENNAQSEDNKNITDFKIRSKHFKTPIKPIMPNNETTTSNINSGIKNSKTEANSNVQVTAPNNIFICDVCKKEYVCKSLLENHIKKLHIIEIDSKPNSLNYPNTNYQHYKNTNLLKGKDVLKNNNVTRNKKKHKDSISSNETQYKCSYCSKIFNDGAHLARHVRIHTGEKPYKCKYCTKCFTQSHALVTHVRIHTGEKPYKCKYCTKCFTQSHALATHVRIHTGEKPYKCSYCTKCFTTSGDLACHVRIHTGEKPYQCSYCTKCFTASGDLPRHVRIHTGEKPYKCSYCTKCFTKKSDLSRHVRIHTGEKPYKCSYCTKCFSDSSHLAKHVRIHTEKKTYKCNYCIKCYYTSGELATHVRTHTGEKPYKCSYCTKCFPHSSQLARHVRIHTGEQPYKCSYCTKCFPQSNELARHVRIHTGEKPYKCSYCTKYFTESSALACHVRIHTGEKPYKCHYCTKCFTTSGYLACHVRIHTGEKPYKCSYCLKCFYTSGELATHVRIHTREQPYKCSYCTKCFTKSSALAKHVRIHTREKEK